MAITRPKASTIAICIALFFFFILITFPFGNLRGAIFGKIYKTTGIVLIADEIYPSFFGWPGLGIRNVDVTLPLAGGELELSCKKLIFRVGIGSLIPFAPSVSMSMEGLKQGGDLYVKFSQSKTTLDAKFDADAVALEQISIPGMAEPFSGTLNSEGYLTYDSSDPSKGVGKIDLNAEKLRVPGANIQGFIFPAMTMGSVKGQLNLKNGIAEFTNFQIGSKDSDFGGSILGDLRLGRDFLSTFVNLTLRLRLSQRYRQNPQSETVVSLLNTFKTATDGEYAMRWNASIMEMQSNPLSAIPQAVP